MNWYVYVVVVVCMKQCVNYGRLDYDYDSGYIVAFYYTL